MLVAIEGPDAVGKDTIIDILVKKYNYINAVHFPTYKLYDSSKNDSTNYMRKMLTDYLHGTDNIDDFTFQILSFMDKFNYYDKFTKYKKSKKIYLINRYISSSIIYGLLSIAQNSNYVVSDVMSIITNINKMLIQPDVDIAILSNIESITQRISNREDKSRYEDLDFIQSVLDCYTYMYLDDNRKAYPEYIMHTAFYNNNDSSPEHVADEIHEFINKYRAIK